MARYAVINGNIVSNVIMADDKEATEAALNCVLVEFTDDNPASVGGSYNPETGRFVTPVVEEDLTVEPTMEETDANAQ